MEFQQQSPDFVLPDAERGVESRRGEDLDGGKPAKVSPVIAVGRGGDGGAVVAEVSADE